MNEQQPSQPTAKESADLIAFVNRQRLLRRESENRTIATAIWLAKQK